MTGGTYNTLPWARKNTRKNKLCPLNVHSSKMHTEVQLFPQFLLQFCDIPGFLMGEVRNLVISLDVKGRSN